MTLFGTLFLKFPNVIPFYFQYITEICMMYLTWQKKKIRIHFSSKRAIIVIYFKDNLLILIFSHSLFWLICTEHLDASYSFGKCVHVLLLCIFPFGLINDSGLSGLYTYVLCLTSSRAKSSQNDNSKSIYCVSVAFHITFI